MNQTLFLSQLRVIILVGIAYAAGKGWLSPADSTAITSVLAPLGVIVGPWIWSFYSNFNKKLVPKDSVAVHVTDVNDANFPGLQRGVPVDVGSKIVLPDPVKVVGALLFAIILGALIFPGAAFAQGKKLPIPLPFDPMGLNGNAVNGAKLTGNAVVDLTAALDAKLLPDLQYALKLATASNNQVTSPCFQAWIDIINTRLNAVKNADGTAMDLPDPHLVTDFEKLVEMRNALQPESPFMIKCSPVASMVKLDIAKFMGLVISGGAGLATLVPGL